MRGKANPKRQPESPEAGKAKAKPKGEPKHSRVVSWDDNVQKMNKELAEDAVPHIQAKQEVVDSTNGQLHKSNAAQWA